MLNGVAPIFIFTFPVVPPSVANALSSVPYVGNFLQDVGLPIPIYLDEKFTNIAVDSDTKNIDIDTEVKANTDPNKPPIVKQNALDSTVTVNLVAVKDSLLLTILLAMSDLIFTRAASQAYTVTYLNGPITVFNGTMKSFSTSANADSTKLDVSITLSRANYRAPTIQPSLPSVSNSGVNTAMPVNASGGALQAG